MQILRKSGRSILLASLLAGITACDDALPPSTQPAAPIEKPKTTFFFAADTASQKAVSEENTFPLEKHHQLAALIAEHHYMQPEIAEILPHIATSSQLKQYLHSLDIYSKYLSPEENKFFQKRGETERTDVGLDLLVHNKEILAVPAEGSSSYQAGFTQPRYLVSLNDKVLDYDDFSTYRFLGELTPSTRVSVKVEAPLTVEVLSYSIPVKKIERKFAIYTESEELAIIDIREFREITTHKVQSLLDKIAHKKALIIDLRYCPGGDLYSTVDMLSLFLEPKLNVVQLTRKGLNEPVILQSLKGEKFNDIPIYLLTSKYTASSAEVFIHALKRYLKNVRILGEATTGKCLALEKYEFKDGSALQLSTYEILTPDGQSCNGQPIHPDVVIPHIELLDINEIIPHL